MERGGGGCGEHTRAASRTGGRRGPAWRRGAGMSESEAQGGVWGSNGDCTRQPRVGSGQLPPRTEPATEHMQAGRLGLQAGRWRVCTVQRPVPQPPQEQRQQTGVGQRKWCAPAEGARTRSCLPPSDDRREDGDRRGDCVAQLPRGDCCEAEGVRGAMRRGQDVEEGVPPIDGAEWRWRRGAYHTHRRYHAAEDGSEH
jgi:hypothetical protein